MRALWLQPDPEWLEHRRKIGADHLDEVWDGVLHVAPQPTSLHQGFATDLEAVLYPLAKAVGLRLFNVLAVYDPIRGESNYRTPDLVVMDPNYVSKRGAEGRCEIAVEVLSPNDESREKFDFYAKHGVQEVWLVDPISRDIEVYVLRGDVYFTVAPNRHGVIEAPRLGLELQKIDGPKLRIGWADGSSEI